MIERNDHIPPHTERVSTLSRAPGPSLSRLAEFLAEDYARLKRYLGETRFNAMVRDYAADLPCAQGNARWLSRHLPDFLQAAGPLRGQPEIAELARLERALNDARDGPDSPVATLQEFEAIAQDHLAGAVFDLTPAAQVFAVRTNVASLWSALRCEEAPPCPIDLDEPLCILVWRQAANSRFRILGAEETMAIDGAAQGLDFAAICEMIAARGEADDAALRAANYLRGWLEAEMIARVRLKGPGAK